MESQVEQTITSFILDKLGVAIDGVFGFIAMLFSYPDWLYVSFLFLISLAVLNNRMFRGLSTWTKRTIVMVIGLILGILFIFYNYLTTDGSLIKMLEYLAKIAISILTTFVFFHFVWKNSIKLYNFTVNFLKTFLLSFIAKRKGKNNG